MVVVHHVEGQIVENTGNSFFFSAYGTGARGVELFFAISGFIIFYAHHPDFGKKEKILEYLFKRAARILPSTLVVATAWASITILARAIGMEAPTISISTWASSALVIPMLDQPSPVVIWSLRNELVFYAIFSFFLLGPRIGVGALLVWMVFCLATESSGSLVSATHDIFQKTVASDINVIFLFGALAYFASSKIENFRRGLSSTFVPFLAAFIAAAYIDANINNVHPALIGLLAGMTVFSASFLELKGALSRFACKLGDASYSLYLTHMPVIAISFAILNRIGMPAIYTFLLETLASVAAGLLFYTYFESKIASSTRIMGNKLFRAK